MNSVSTNPFDDDEDEIEEHVELSTSNTLEVTKVQKASKPPRKKKRQAPPPPPSQKQMVKNHIFKVSIKKFNNYFYKKSLSLIGILKK